MADIALVVTGLLAGLVLGWLVARLRAATQLARLDATLSAARAGEARLEQAMRSLTYEATAQSQEAVARAVGPLQETLRRYEQQVAGLERDRIDAYGQLRAQLSQVQATSLSLRDETGRLVSALRSPQVRGRWGEHHLRRIVEAAGLLEHCDFAEQVRVGTDQGGRRPDLVVRLPGDRIVVVDAKAPFDSYLSAVQAEDDRSRDEYLSSHARTLRAHIDQVAAKRYWDAFDQTPEFVVLFLPADPVLDAALARDSTLMEHSFARNVVLATPATLIALLRTIAFTIRQDAMTRNAAEVFRTARELHGRLSTMGEHLEKVGSSLGGAVTAYNRAIGSLESRVLVSARRLADLGVAATAVETPPQVEVLPRQPQSPELTAADG